MFRLSKWYLDLVTDRGTVLILYAARVRWGLVGFHYASVLHGDGPGPFCDEHSFRRSELPRIEGDVLTWSNGPLHVRGRWERDAVPVAQVLADGPSGAIRWSCHMPRARASVVCGATELTGVGYAESLDLTVGPSRLPFHELRWGRHLSPEHAVVWIAWDHSADTRWAWVDGVAQGFSPARDLRLWDSRDVRDRHIFGLHEHKQVSRSAIVRDGVSLDSGWAIHEVVRR